MATGRSAPAYRSTLPELGLVCLGAARIVSWSPRGPAGLRRARGTSVGPPCRWLGSGRRSGGSAGTSGDGAGARGRATTARCVGASDPQDITDVLGGELLNLPQDKHQRLPERCRIKAAGMPFGEAGVFSVTPQAIIAFHGQPMGVSRGYAQRVQPGLKLSTLWRDYPPSGRHAGFRVGGRWCLGVEIRNREQQLVITGWDVLSKVSHPADDRIDALFR